MNREEKKPVWPKERIRLTPEEDNILDSVFEDAQDWGYTGLFGWVQNLGHRKLGRLSTLKDALGNIKSLEIGCGSGWHFQFIEEQFHIGMDMRVRLLKRARQNFPRTPVLAGDGYFLPVKTGSLDQVRSIYVLEHLNNLPACISEINRVLKPGGEFLLALPAEGGLCYNLGRQVTSKRYFEKKYHVDYMKLVQSEHCNTCSEVLSEVKRWFQMVKIEYLPFEIPWIDCNAVVIGCFIKKKK